MIVHFDFGQKWNLMQGWGRRGGGKGAGTPSLSAFTTSKYTFTTKAKQGLLLQPVGQPGILPQRRLVALQLLDQSE